MSVADNSCDSKPHISLLAVDLVALKETSRDFPKNLVPPSVIDFVMPPYELTKKFYQ